MILWYYVQIGRIHGSSNSEMEQEQLCLLSFPETNQRNLCLSFSKLHSVDIGVLVLRMQCFHWKTQQMFYQILSYAATLSLYASYINESSGKEVSPFRNWLSAGGIFCTEVYLAPLGTPLPILKANGQVELSQLENDEQRLRLVKVGLSCSSGKHLTKSCFTRG